METVAKLRNYPSSPRKMRLVADLIRGLDVDKAISMLKFTRKHAARPMERLVLTAVNNWEQETGENATSSDLFVKEIRVDAGATLKRFRPAPFGRAHRIRKRSNHVTIVLGSRKTVSDDTATSDTAVVNEETEN